MLLLLLLLLHPTVPATTLRHDSDENCDHHDSDNYDCNCKCKTTTSTSTVTATTLACVDVVVTRDTHLSLLLTVLSVGRRITGAI